MSYHASHRGPQILTFIASQGPTAIAATTTGSQAELPAHDGVIMRRFKPYTVPSHRVTTYACQSMSFDVTGDDKHVIAVRPLINPTTAFANHHAILHVCTSNAFWDDHTTPKPCSQARRRRAPSQMDAWRCRPLRSFPSDAFTTPTCRAWVPKGSLRSVSSTLAAVA